MKIKIFFLFLTFGFFIYNAQKFQALDNETKEHIPFINYEFESKAEIVMQNISNEKGQITISESLNFDTLTISCLGYKNLEFPKNKITNAVYLTLLMKNYKKLNMKKIIKIIGLITIPFLIIFIFLVIKFTNVFIKNKNIIEETPKIQELDFKIKKIKLINSLSLKTLEIDSELKDSVVIKHFGTYCVPCIENMDIYNNELYNNNIFYVSFEENEKIKSLIKRKKYKFPIYSANRNDDFFSQYEVKILPSELKLKDSFVTLSR